MTNHQFVDPVVTKKKLQRDLEHWNTHSRARERGWLLLSADVDQLLVEVAFTARISLSAGSGPMSAVVCAIRLDYSNYDVLPPSLTFIDFISGEPATPHVGAFVPTEAGPRNVLIAAHPDTRQPFLCIPGIREYHTHPQHSGDDWLLHRSQGEGSLLTICERVWRFMALNVIGLNLVLQGLPTWPLQAQIQLRLSQGDMLAASSREEVAAEEEDSSE